MEIRTYSSRHPNFARDLVLEPLTAEELGERACVECEGPIRKNHLVSKRKDALTCSDRCRKRRERRGRAKVGLRFTENKGDRVGQVKLSMNCIPRKGL
jgi:hypothetical protein